MNDKPKAAATCSRFIAEQFGLLNMPEHLLEITDEPVCVRCGQLAVGDDNGEMVCADCYRRRPGFWEMPATLLDALCKVNGQQGGTIYQFFPAGDWHPMQSAFQDYVKAGIEFPSRASFDKLAKQYGLTISWVK